MKFTRVLVEKTSADEYKVLLSDEKNVKFTKVFQGALADCQTLKNAFLKVGFTLSAKEVKEKETDWKKYDRICLNMDNKVAAAIKASGQRKIYVDYSAYKTNKNDLPIDNLSKIAVTGKVVLVSNRSEFYGGKKSKSYRSDVLVDPTWLEVAVHANVMIRTTRDQHHVFLEGLSKQSVENDVTTYEFNMGS